MTTPFLLTDLKVDEGLRLRAYPDPVSHGAPWTIGYGHTGLDVHPALVWTLAQCDAALVADVAKSEQGLDHVLPWWRTLSDLRQDVLANMAFNMGVEGLEAFKTALGLIQRGQYAAGGAALLVSAWARQLPNRSSRLARQMESGVHA